MKFNLEIKAQLENIGHFAPEDVDSFEWNIKFMCTECNEQKETFRVLSSETKYPNKSGKGESHLVETCHFCGRGGSVEILTDIKASYTDADEGKFVTIGSFECRGMEPVDFCFGGGFRVQAANSGTVFEPVDLSEKEWTDYDASAKEAVSRSNVKGKIQNMYYLNKFVIEDLFRHYGIGKSFCEEKVKLDNVIGYTRKSTLSSSALC